MKGSVDVLDRRGYSERKNLGSSRCDVQRRPGECGVVIRAGEFDRRKIVRLRPSNTCLVFVRSGRKELEKSHSKEGCRTHLSRSYVIFRIGKTRSVIPSVKEPQKPRMRRANTIVRVAAYLLPENRVSGHSCPEAIHLTYLCFPRKSSNMNMKRS